jgi:hypothetical protein
MVDSTVIDGGGGAFVIRVDRSAGPETKLVGLTLRNGDDGVFAQTTLSFLNNVVRDTKDGIDYDSNAAGSPSGGVVRNSLFEANSDDAIDLDDDVAVVIENNVLRNNGDDGIEIRLHDYRGPLLEIVVRHNVITGNGEDGIQLIDGDSLSDRSFRFEGNVIAGNADAGVGMMANMVTREDFSGADLGELVVLANNTIVGNNHGVTGGDNVVLVNNIVADNANVGLKRSRGESAAAHNLFFGNGTDFQDAVFDTGTTITADPDLGAGYAPGEGSPAIDAGVAAFNWNGATIIDKASSDYNGSAPDLGAREARSGPRNRQPVVDAGSDIVVTMPAPAALRGSVTDDGLPNPPAAVEIGWSVVSGPGTVAFDDPSALDARASFSRDGVYVLRLDADDSQATAHDEITVTVRPAAGGTTTTLDIVVASSSDDAEERGSGRVNLTDEVLHLLRPNRTAGIRFTDVAIPTGATIVNAYVQFTVDTPGQGNSRLTIQAEAADHAGTFERVRYGVSSRPRTAAEVRWAPPTWTVAGTAQRTADISALIQEIVRREGWSEGNAIALLISGSGKRIAQSFNSDPDRAPLLHIEYTMQQPLQRISPVPVVSSAATGAPDIAEPCEPDGRVRGNPSFRVHVTWHQKCRCGRAHGYRTEHRPGWNRGMVNGDCSYKRRIRAGRGRRSRRRAAIRPVAG